MIRHKTILGIVLCCGVYVLLPGNAAQAQFDDDGPPPSFESFGDGGRGDRGGRDGRGGRGFGDRGFGDRGFGGGFGERGSGDRGFGGRGSSDRGSGDRGFGGRRGESGPGNPPRGAAPGQPGARTKVRVGRVGPKLPPPATLPSQYAAKDTNRDGQIGLYEWSRSDISTFQKLDINRDGIITPAELINPGRGRDVQTVASTSTSSPPSSGGGSVAASVSSTPASAAPSGPAADPKVVAAESAFDFLDSNKDSSLSTEEWERSRNARKMFTDAKVDVQIPLTKGKFVESYVKLSK